MNRKEDAQTIPGRERNPVSFSLLVLWVLVASTQFAFGDEALLSGNATYRILSEGYAYPGQIQPGENVPAKTEGWMPAPLVEGTDTGDLLIDGRTDTMVYTPWYWNQQAKRIIVEMTLPGPSKVSRVVVRFPDNLSYRGATVTLSAKDAGGGWKEVVTGDTSKGLPPGSERKQEVALELGGIECRELKIVAVEHTGPQLGLAEIEVYGTGPTESAARGLIRSKPHVETVVVSLPQIPADSTLLTKPGKAKIKLSGTPLTSGSERSLIDGDRQTVARIDAKPHEHLSLTADIEFDGVYQIDAVNVVMPGGKGAETGHVHFFTLAARPGSEGTIWQDGDAVINPYLPHDDAPKPYLVPLVTKAMLGQSLRITAILQGSGGLTSRLAMAEIEVWGRAADPSKDKLSSVRLNLKPIRIKREPVGPLHPKLRWLTEEKIRGAWIGDNLADLFSGTNNTKAEVLKEAGFNLVWKTMSPDNDNRSVSTMLKNALPADLREARRIGLPLLIGWQYGSSHEEPYRKYRSSSGVLAQRSCCPLDADYIERHVGRWAVAIAQAGADGMGIDTEMYESDASNYPGPCVCDDCFTTYLKTFSTDWQALYDQVPPETRGQWLGANQAAEHYGLFQAARIEKLYDGIRARCQAINPAFFFAHAPLLHHVPGIERGLGTSTVPCLVFSEFEYWSGPGRQSYANADRIRKEGIPALYICGSFLIEQSPEMVERGALDACLYTDGWWMFYASGILNNPEKTDETVAPHYTGRWAGTTARDYLDRITAVHRRLEELLSGPKSRWPTPNEPAPPPSADIGRRTGTITIDGLLDDGAWQSATRFQLTTDLNGKAAESPATTFLACWDDQAFYLAAKCRLAEGAKLSVPERGRDNGELWRYGVEVFLDPGRSKNKYAHFVISPLGDVYDSLVDPATGSGVYGNSAWSIDVKVAAADSGDEYVVEARIPFAGLSPPPSAGEKWGANFCRYSPSAQTWSPTYGGFHNPANFGTITFSAGSAAVNDPTGKSRRGAVDKVLPPATPPG